MRASTKIVLSLLPLWLFVALFRVPASTHYTLMSPYGEQFFDIWLVGLIIGVASFGQVLLDVPAGKLLDRFGYVRMLKISTAVFFLAALCIASGLNSVTFGLSIALAVVGWLFYNPGISAYILSTAREEESGRFYSIREIVASLAVVASALPILALWIAYYFSMHRDPMLWKSATCRRLPYRHAGT